MEKQQRDREIRMDIAFFLMFFAMVFIYISLSGYGANVGRAVRMILFGIFGIGAWIVPLWIFVLCFFLISQKGGRQMPVRLFAAALIILLIQSADHLYLHTSGRISLDVPFHVKETFHLCADNSFGGGIPGGWFARLLYRAFGVIGSWLVYFGMLVISLILLSQQSPAGAIRTMRERREEKGIPSFSERREIRRIRRQQEREAAEEERELREAERILEREDRAAARAREREERAQDQRRRRGSGGTRSLDLEHTRLDKGQSGNRARADSNSGKGRRRSGVISNMDRRRDVHEIQVLTDEGREPLTVLAAGGDIEPEGTVYRRSGQSAFGSSAQGEASVHTGADLYTGNEGAAGSAGTDAGTYNIGITEVTAGMGDPDDNGLDFITAGHAGQEDPSDMSSAETAKTGRQLTGAPGRTGRDFTAVPGGDLSAVSGRELSAVSGRERHKDRAEILLLLLRRIFRAFPFTGRQRKKRKAASLPDLLLPSARPPAMFPRHSLFLKGAKAVKTRRRNAS